MTLPRHIAIIMDGNGRWALARNLPRTRGHEHGAGAVRAAVYGCRDRGVETLTLYAFSAANWSRPKDEVDVLMRLIKEFAERERAQLVERGVAVQVIGDLDEAPTPTRHAVEDLLTATRDGRAMTLALALSYGGRRDVVSAMRAVAAQARAGLVLPEDIDEASLKTFLSTRSLPDPDLVIRTGGERRLSDFLLVESAYSELFFTETLWPDFTADTLDQAIASYARRERRYGRVAEARTSA